jgi:hypothetical protein
MSMHALRHVKVAATLAGAGVLVLIGTTASASIPSSSGTIYGCYAKTNGATRIIDPAKQKCAGTENPISWNQRGPTGPRGPRGPKGDTGAPGVAGISGYEVRHTTFSATLPIDQTFSVLCGTGKSAFGGGAVVQLFDDTATSKGLGAAPIYSIPTATGDGWDVHISEPLANGATNALITVSVTCVVAGQ